MRLKFIPSDLFFLIGMAIMNLAFYQTGSNYIHYIGLNSVFLLLMITIGRLSYDLSKLRKVSE